jgi:hypothetical protein
MILSRTKSATNFCVGLKDAEAQFLSEKNNYHLF